MNYKTINKSLFTTLFSFTTTVIFSQQLILSESNFNLGKMKINDKKVVNVTIKNSTDSPIVISNATIPCKCTKVDYSKKPLMPRDSSFIKITFEAKESGAFYKKITLFHTAEEKQSVIAIKGIIE